MSILESLRRGFQGTPASQFLSHYKSNSMSIRKKIVPKKSSYNDQEKISRKNASTSQKIELQDISFGNDCENLNMSSYQLYKQKQKHNKVKVALSSREKKLYQELPSSLRVRQRMKKNQRLYEAYQEDGRIHSKNSISGSKKLVSDSGFISGKSEIHSRNQLRKKQFQNRKTLTSINHRHTKNIINPEVIQRTERSFEFRPWSPSKNQHIAYRKQVVLGDDQFFAGL